MVTTVPAVTVSPAPLPVVAAAIGGPVHARVRARPHPETRAPTAAHGVGVGA